MVQIFYSPFACFVKRFVVFYSTGPLNYANNVNKEVLILHEFDCVPIPENANAILSEKMPIKNSEEEIILRTELS